MFSIFFSLLPILQALSAGITIWGFYNTPAFTDTVVTYGASAVAESTFWSDLLNSIGSIVIGSGGLVATWIAQHRTGAKSELYSAIVNLIGQPTNTLAILRVAFAFIDILAAKWGTDPKDIEAIQFLRDWLTAKFTDETKQSNPFTNK